MLLVSYKNDSSAIVFEYYMLAIYLANTKHLHCAKNVRIRNYSGVNVGKCGVSLRIQSKYGKMRSRIIPNTSTFHSVLM